MAPAAAEGAAVSGPVAITTCAGMAVLYVAILYSPTLVLRLSPPTSLNSFMVRRFVCALVSSIASVVATSALLGVKRFGETSSIFSILGVRGDHMWQAVGFPILLTSLLYAGTLVSKFFSNVLTWREARVSHGGELTIAGFFRNFRDRVLMLARNVLTWRNYVVAPVTEELVFRACMVPLLLCGGLRIYNIVFFSPVFFSLAHLNHLLELYYQKGCSFLRASTVVGVQLGYTVVFGWYAAFLFIRTGSLLSPVAAHVFCNIMGLPALSSSRLKVAFVGGAVAFFAFLFPATDPGLYNDRTYGCKCWHGYCSWA